MGNKMSSYSLTYTNRFYKSQGVQPIENLSPALLDKIAHLTALRAQPQGSVASEELAKASHDVAYELIDMLFRRDFSGDGKHWSFDGHHATAVASKNPEIEETYEVSESYCWDWKDIYSIAESKGVVTFNHEKKTIFLKDYGFYCSG